jgi:hypothetical protein
MADDAVLAFDRSAILQRMPTGRIAATGDTHARLLPRPEPVPPRARPGTATGDGKRDIAAIDGVRATAEHIVGSFLSPYRIRTELGKPRSKPGEREHSGTYGEGTVRRQKLVVAMGNGSPTLAEAIS